MSEDVSTAAQTVDAIAPATLAFPCGDVGLVAVAGALEVRLATLEPDMIEAIRRGVFALRLARIGKDVSGASQEQQALAA